MLGSRNFQWWSHRGEPWSKVKLGWWGSALVYGGHFQVNTNKRMRQKFFFSRYTKERWYLKLGVNARIAEAVKYDSSCICVCVCTCVFWMFISSILLITINTCDPEKQANSSKTSPITDYLTEMANSSNSQFPNFSNFVHLPKTWVFKVCKNNHITLKLKNLWVETHIKAYVLI